MQTEWSPGRNDEDGNSRDAVAAPDGPLAAGASPAIFPMPGDATADGLATYESSTRSDADATGEPDGDVDLDPAHGGVTGTDAASQVGEDGEAEAQLSAVDAVDGLLDEVELALARLDDGTYGRCATCGSLITDTELAEDPLIRECRSCGAGVLATEGA